MSIMITAAVKTKVSMPITVTTKVMITTIIGKHNHHITPHIGKKEAILHIL